MLVPLAVTEIYFVGLKTVLLMGKENYSATS